MLTYIVYGYLKLDKDIYIFTYILYESLYLDTGSQCSE